MSKIKQVTTVDFSDIFWFAEKPPHKVDWNKCNDIFFGDLLDYKSYNTLYLSDLEHNLKYDKEHPKSKYSYTEDQKKARLIMIDFMKAEGLTMMMVLNN